MREALKDAKGPGPLKLLLGGGAVILASAAAAFAVAGLDSLFARLAGLLA